MSMQGSAMTYAMGSVYLVVPVVRDADQIAVLQAGRVVEAGTHESLLDRGGRYADLVAASERAAYALVG